MIYGVFPHFNPKCGNNITTEWLDEEEHAEFMTGTLDMEAFWERLRDKFRKLYPWLWSNP
jgi:hypothetical protein